MTSKAEIHASPETAPRGKAPGNAIESLALLVGRMNRFLAVLSQCESLEGGKLGVAQWLVLSLLAPEKKNGMTLAQISDQLGISEQRVRELCESMKRAQFIWLKKADDESTADTAMIGKGGWTRLEELSADLTGIVSSLKPSRLDVLGRKIGKLTEALVQLREDSSAAEAGSDDAAKEDEEPAPDEPANLF